MSLLMFVTDDGISPEGSGPTLFVRDDPAVSLPPHPRGYHWRYFASVQIDDTMLAPERDRIERDIVQRGACISPRLVYVGAKT